MPVQFNAKRAIEAAAYLLHLSGRRMKMLGLVKMLYIGDRESIRKAGLPIVGDNDFALEQGPIQGSFVDMAMGSSHIHESIRDLWLETATRPKNKYSWVDLKVTPDFPWELSEEDMGILKDVYEENKGLTLPELIEKTHQFEEWKKWETSGSKSLPISSDEIVDALHFPEEVAQEVKAQVNSYLSPKKSWNENSEPEYA